MQTITTIGFDIAKSLFQVHGVDAAGRVVIRRQLKRRSVLAFFTCFWTAPKPLPRPGRAITAIFRSVSNPKVRLLTISELA